MYQNNYNGYAAAQLRTPAATALKGRPVSSLEEARAATIDFDGSIFFFPDIANKKIYTKQINLDGTASLKMYEYKEIPTMAETNYITRDEFNAKLTEIKKMLNTQPKEEEMIVQQPAQQKYNF